MTESATLQEPFLNNLRKEKKVVSIFLVNGKRLVGSIVSFDKYVILLKSGDGQTLVYKHAITSIVPTSGTVSNRDY